jgi:hypothetical protein
MKTDKKTIDYSSKTSLLTRCHARAMSRACGMLVRCCGFVEKIKKIWRKTIAIYNVFKEKTIKLNS